MLLISFVLLLVINALQAWQRRRSGAPDDERTLEIACAARSAGTTEAAWVRRTLIGLALAFMLLFLVLPLAAVFAEALRKGFGAYLEAPARARCLGAIR